jgi:hypothetical protein
MIFWSLGWTIVGSSSASIQQQVRAEKRTSLGRLRGTLRELPLKSSRLERDAFVRDIKVNREQCKRDTKGNMYKREKRAKACLWN